MTAVDCALVLVAEDDPDLRDLMGLLLRHDGLRVAAVEDGAAVVGACVEHRPDLLLLDLTLPGLSGVDVCTAVRSEADLVGLAILLVTGMGREHGVDAALRAGADDYLMKPFRPAELTARVRELLARQSRGTPA